MSAQLLFVRHGETAWNEAGRYQGRSDPPLSPKGEAQARAVAESLRHGAIGMIISSPLRRAYQTALAVGDNAGLSIVRDERLAELGFGDWEGLTQAEVKRLWPELLRQWKRFPDNVRFPHGECLALAQQRLTSFLRCPPWTPEAGQGMIVVVAHAAIIRIARLMAQRMPLAAYREVHAHPASLHPFSLSNGHLTAITVDHIAEGQAYRTARR
jgi:broad specificity phosphatase PhoE